MNKLLANLNVMYIKIHTLHYNVIGSDFYPTHIFLEQEYNKFHEWIDIIAERTKIIGQYPESTLEDFLSNKTIIDTEVKDYTSKEAYAILKEDYILLVSDIIDLKNGADNITINSLEEIQEELEKKLWFIDSILK